MTDNDFLQLLAGTLHVSDNIKVDTQLSDIWDSMGQIEVLSMLGDNFNVTLEMEELVSIKTAQDIIEILKSKKIAFD